MAKKIHLTIGIISALVVLFFTWIRFYSLTIQKSATTLDTSYSKTATNQTLFEQLSKLPQDKITVLSEPVVIEREEIPADWDIAQSDNGDFELQYPPAWSHVGDGGFCMKPIYGSCQDAFPSHYILIPEYENEQTFRTTTEKRLSFEDRRLRSVGFAYEQTFAKLELDSFDGVVEYLRKSTEPESDLVARKIYIQMDGSVHVFFINIDDPVQRKVFSSLREI